MSLTPYYQDDYATLYHGDALETLKKLPGESIQCCVTSPPYWGLRDYGVEGQLGLENTPEKYVDKIVEIFREVKRVLRSDGTLWLNMGDSYWANRYTPDAKYGGVINPSISKPEHLRAGGKYHSYLKPKDLIGLPWLVAFALQRDGWFLRKDIIWYKKNPMPESTKDRPTTAHEYLFLLSKSNKYFYDGEAIKEKASYNTHARGNGVNPKAMNIPGGWDTSKGDYNHHVLNGNGRYKHKQNESFSSSVNQVVEFRNKRSVWEIGTEPFVDAHFATFPTKLVEPCILAGIRSNDGIVLDPFAGSGTVAQVAKEHNRKSISIELNEEYLPMQMKRLQQEVLAL